MDVVRLACERACERFGGHDGVFNSAGFGQALGEFAGVKDSLDGRWVEAILWGREDVTPLKGGAHWQLANRPRRKSNE